MTKIFEKAKVIDAFSALLFMGKVCLRESQSPEILGKPGARKTLVEETQVRGHLN